MSWKLTPILTCDGCGTTIDIDTYVTLRPTEQTILQKDPDMPASRHFCCEACEVWWKAEYPESGPWGAAWNERHWWWEQTGPHVNVRSEHAEEPLAHNHSYFDKPEPTT